MEQIIKIILLGVLGILELMLYFILVATVAPKILKNHCAIRTTSDRGLKKYVYPNGRGIAYEPHPSHRKYVPHYLLFTEDGYKYVRCQLDAGVACIDYSVVMFDRHDRVIDVIDVVETKISACESKPVMLHADTSYIALVLDTVNGVPIKHETVIRCHLWQLAVYSAVMGLLCFAQMVLLTGALRYFDTRFIHLGLADGVGNASFVLPAIVIGLLAGLLAFLHYRKKGVSWSI